MLEQMRQAGEREAALHQSIKAIADNMSMLPRRKPKPMGAGRACTRTNVTTLAPPTGSNGIGSRDEDIQQDGERQATKQAPERLHQCL